MAAVRRFQKISFYRLQRYYKRIIFTTEGQSNAVQINTYIKPFNTHVYKMMIIKGIAVNYRSVVRLLLLLVCMDKKESSSIVRPGRLLEATDYRRPSVCMIGSPRTNTSAVTTSRPSYIICTLFLIFCYLFSVNTFLKNLFTRVIIAIYDLYTC